MQQSHSGDYLSTRPSNVMAQNAKHQSVGPKDKKHFNLTVLGSKSVTEALMKKHMVHEGSHSKDPRDFNEYEIEHVKSKDIVLNRNSKQVACKMIFSSIHDDAFSCPFMGFDNTDAFIINYKAFNEVEKKLLNSLIERIQEFHGRNIPIIVAISLDIDNEHLFDELQRDRHMSYAPSELGRYDSTDACLVALNCGKGINSLFDMVATKLIEKEELLKHRMKELLTAFKTNDELDRLTELMAPDFLLEWRPSKNKTADISQNAFENERVIQRILTVKSMMPIIKNEITNHICKTYDDFHDNLDIITQLKGSIDFSDHETEKTNHYIWRIQRLKHDYKQASLWEKLTYDWVDDECTQLSYSKIAYDPKVTNDFTRFPISQFFFEATRGDGACKIGKYMSDAKDDAVIKLLFGIVNTELSTLDFENLSLVGLSPKIWNIFFDTVDSTTISSLILKRTGFKLILRDSDRREAFLQGMKKCKKIACLDLEDNQIYEFGHLDNAWKSFWKMLGGSNLSSLNICERESFPMDTVSWKCNLSLTASDFFKPMLEGMKSSKLTSFAISWELLHHLERSPNGKNQSWNSWNKFWMTIKQRGLTSLCLNSIYYKESSNDWESLFNGIEQNGLKSLKLAYDISGWRTNAWENLLSGLSKSNVINLSIDGSNLTPAQKKQIDSILDGKRSKAALKDGGLQKLCRYTIWSMFNAELENNTFTADTLSSPITDIPEGISALIKEGEEECKAKANVRFG